MWYCGGQVGEISTSRSGLSLAWVRCPLAGACKLSQARMIALGWSTGKDEAIGMRPLQCFKCLELGHVRATCVPTANRSHLCYKCGESGHRARGCSSSTHKCPLCESLGAPAAHRMGGAACRPPKTRKNGRELAGAVRHGDNAASQHLVGGSTAKAVDGWEEAMDLVQ
ncbi:uncharacterized protein LOC126874821 [Bombus huntii]|uniref:uncharacterized protein LOC126874821 n=1 Tax=Bombus huntii TaxID=85661 RepID=UPI0021A9DB94|nr:uncharacterized protein LOC126874821 [Bombus huntii]